MFMTLSSDLADGMLVVGVVSAASALLGPLFWWALTTPITWPKNAATRA